MWWRSHFASRVGDFVDRPYYTFMNVFKTLGSIYAASSLDSGRALSRLVQERVSVVIHQAFHAWCAKRDRRRRHKLPRQGRWRDNRPVRRKGDKNRRGSTNTGRFESPSKPRAPTGLSSAHLGQSLCPQITAHVVEKVQRSQGVGFGRHQYVLSKIAVEKKSSASLRSRYNITENKTTRC